MDAIILAAGLGTRLRPHTLTTPKPLLPIRGRPLLDWALHALPPVVDRVLVVDAPLERQIERLLERDAESEKQARAMISAQAGRKTRLAHADDLITNEGTLADLEAQVERLHRRYLRLADERQAQ